MRKYAKIYPSFWTGATGSALRHAGHQVQLVATYLISNPHSNCICLYRLPLAYVTTDLSMSPSDVRQALKLIEATGFIKYDSDAELVWVVEGARWQLGEPQSSTAKRDATAQREFDRIPPESPFRDEFFERYGKVYRLKLDGLRSSRL